MSYRYQFCYVSYAIKTSFLGAWERMQEVRKFDDNPDGLSLIPRTYMVEEEN